MGPNCEQSNPLGHLDNTLITDEELKTFAEWNKYDAAHEDEENDGNFCQPDGQFTFVYLLL